VEPRVCGRPVGASRPKQLLSLGRPANRSWPPHFADERFAGPRKRTLIVTAADQAQGHSRSPAGPPGDSLVVEQRHATRLPAVAWRAPHARRAGQDALLAVVPSDAFIKNESRYAPCANRAGAGQAQGPSSPSAIKPTHAGNRLRLPANRARVQASADVATVARLRWRSPTAETCHPLSGLRQTNLWTSACLLFLPLLLSEARHVAQRRHCLQPWPRSAGSRSRFPPCVWLDADGVTNGLGWLAPARFATRVRRYRDSSLMNASEGTTASRRASWPAPSPRCAQPPRAHCRSRVAWRWARPPGCRLEGRAGLRGWLGLIRGRSRSGCAPGPAKALSRRNVAARSDSLAPRLSKLLGPAAPTGRPQTRASTACQDHGRIVQALPSADFYSQDGGLMLLAFVPES